MDDLKKRKEDLWRAVGGFLGFEGSASEHKESFKKKLQENKKVLVWIVFAVIAWFGYNIHTKNLPLLQGRFLVGPDEYAFLRYARYVVQHGSLMNIDYLRYYPTGFSGLAEFKVVTFFMVYLYKVLHFLNSAMTVEMAVILYPAIAFVIGLVFFFLLVNELFDWKAALVASAFLAVLPAYLFRTLAGVSDKEALGMAFFFMAFYFFVKFWKQPEKNLAFVYSLLAGLSTAFMAASWGGVIGIYLVVGLFVLLEILTKGIEIRKLFLYLLFVSSFFAFTELIIPSRFTLIGFFTSITTVFLNFAILLGICDVLVSKNIIPLKKFEHKVPRAFLSLGLALGIALVLALIISPSLLFSIINGLVKQLTTPLVDRWSFTVAESHQPYFTDWVSQFTLGFLALLWIAATLLVHQLLKGLKKTGTILTIASSLTLLFVSISRYAEGTTLDGSGLYSQLLYLGSLVVFPLLLVYFYFSSYSQDKALFEHWRTLPSNYLFVFAWLFVMVLAAKTAIRLLFLFAPVTAVLAGYLVMETWNIASKFKKDILKVGSVLLVLLVLGNMFLSFANAVTYQASYTGPSYDFQWNNAMEWVKKNTSPDAVFAHWWDYGYWVQTGGERATLTDGGNAIGPLNYFMGRHVLTGHSEEEALQFLKAKGATHFLVDPSDIGKYPAYSSIGADANYDRYSWVPTLNLDYNAIRETRNETTYVYSGGTLLDHDFIYEGTVYPGRSAVVGGFLVKVKEIPFFDGNGTQVSSKKIFYDPEAAFFFNGKQDRIPVKCIYQDGEKQEFDVDGFDACLVLIPSQNGDKYDPYGSLLYLSPEVRQTNFGRLYLMNEPGKYFKLVYSDVAQVPLMVYNGRMIGPMKIWELSYPENLTVPEYFIKNEYPDPNVTVVKYL